MVAARIFTAVLLFSFAASAASEMVWHPAPPRSTEGGHGGHNARGGGDLFRLSAGEGASAQLWKPTLERLDLVVGPDGQVKVPPTGIDYYHLLVAQRDHGTLHETALRYFHRFGRPGGHSPSELTAVKKARLEIVPAPLPREHQQYLGGEPAARFTIRYAGAPLADADITLTTSNGTAASFKSDSNGTAQVAFPDDFKHVKAGRGRNPPAEFVIRVKHQDGAQKYVTTLSGAYHVNPSHWQSTTQGMWFVIAGFVTGLVAVGVRRRRGAPDANGRRGG